MISYFAMVVFFGFYCLNFLFPNGALMLITAIAAGIAAIGLIIERYPIPERRP